MLNYWISNRENATERGLIIAEWFEPEPRKSRAPLIIVITLLVTAAAIAAAYFGVRLYNASPKVRLSRSLEAAQEALQSGSYAAAEKEYLAALQIDSGNTKAYTGLCDTYAQEENWDQVEQTLEDALSAGQNRRRRADQSRDLCYDVGSRCLLQQEGLQQQRGLVSPGTGASEQTDAG